jgi:hypothetical protein
VESGQEKLNQGRGTGNEKLFIRLVAGTIPGGDFPNTDHMKLADREGSILLSLEVRAAGRQDRQVVYLLSYYYSN